MTEGTPRYTREYFELDGGDRDDSPTKREMMRAHLRRIESMVPTLRGANVLDVGCASGYFLSLCAEGGMVAHGIDVSEYAIGRASQRAGVAAVACDVCEGLPYADGTFSIVTMFDVIEHLVSPHPALREVSRVLDDGGYLFLTTPNTGSLERLLLGERWSGARDDTHVQLFNRYSIGFLLDRAGFTVARCTSAFPTLPPRISSVLGKTGLGGQLFVAARCGSRENGSAS